MRPKQGEIERLRREVFKVKAEQTARNTCRIRDQAKGDVFHYIECFSNPNRRHSTLGYMSLMEFETKVPLG